MKYEMACESFCIMLKNYKPRIKTLLLSGKERNALRMNRRWKNKYESQRCFIIGNGPSLAKQNISCLRNEKIFTVNQIMRSELYNDLNSEFHVIMDPLYFSGNINESQKESVLENLKKIHPNTECFFPVKSMHFFEENPFDHFRQNFIYCEYLMQRNEKRPVDLTKCCFAYSNVVQFAIEIAIYMGFSSIYLLGCDMTGYKEIEQFATGVFNEQTHIYYENKKMMENTLHKDRTCEKWFAGFAKMFEDYGLLYSYARRKNIKLINLTEGGILDSLPREKLENVVNKFKTNY
ncbi:MAG: DUF115 domain-containing protein [Acetatifactor sp.]|nr:DUF115 domain-containing protein [Acetatifactor sp.]